MGNERSDKRRPAEATAREAIEAFLREELGNVFSGEDYVLVEDGDAGWAFWLCPNDTTSYLHANLSVEWYGTSWSVRRGEDEDC